MNSGEEIPQDDFEGQSVLDLEPFFQQVPLLSHGSLPELILDLVFQDHRFDLEGIYNLVLRDHQTWRAREFSSLLGRPP